MAENWRWKHGPVGTKVYSVWRGMMRRCYEVNNKRYDRYGGRGIRVCKRWHDPGLFAEDVGDVPEGMTLDRPDKALTTPVR